MLQRVPNLLKVLHNISHYNKECLYMFQIGYARRHINTLITYNYNTRYKVQVVANPQKIFTANNVKHLQEWRWILITISKPISVIAKVQKEETVDSSKSTQNNVQRIIELKQENLGQLKERNLDVKPDDNQTKEEQQNLKTEVKKKKTDKRVSSLERNFITPVRAMSDFLLKPSDLENLPKTKRRSPYEFEPPITVFWRKDVEAKAIEVWGSREILAKELLKKELQQKTYQQNIFTVKRRLRDYRREIGSKTQTIDQEGLFGRSGKVVLTAIVINGCNFLCKLCAWLYTGSHSMFSECIHSAADTFNQLILAYGIHKSVQTPNPDHPYGYTNMRYVSSLISGVGIFCVGTGLSIYHGIHGLLNPSTIESFYWAYFILVGSFCEIYTNIFSFLIAMCIVSTFDKFDLARFDVEHLRELYFDHNKAIIAVPLYLVVFCLHQIGAETDDQLNLIHYYNSNHTVWQNVTNVQSLLDDLNSWQRISMSKDLLAVFAWLFVSLGTKDDSFLTYLQSMEKYADDIESSRRS